MLGFTLPSSGASRTGYTLSHRRQICQYQEVKAAATLTEHTLAPHLLLEILELVIVLVRVNPVDKVPNPLISPELRP